MREQVTYNTANHDSGQTAGVHVIYKLQWQMPRGKAQSQIRSTQRCFPSRRNPSAIRFLACVVAAEGLISETRVTPLAVSFMSSRSFVSFVCLLFSSAGKTPRSPSVFSDGKLPDDESIICRRVSEVISKDGSDRSKTWHQRMNRVIASICVSPTHPENYELETHGS